MDKDYIPPSKGYHKLKLARSFQQDVYLYGASGYGKTTLIKQYLDFHNYIYIDYCEQFWDDSVIPEEGKKECTYVVIDNLHLIDQEEIRRAILELAARKDIWLILAGRCKLPEWLKPLYVDNKLMLITEEDMHMTDKEIEALAKKQGMKMSDELRQQFLNYAQGNAYAVMLTFKFISEYQMSPGREMVERIEQAFVSYLENNVVNQWDADIQQFLMKVSVVDEFTGALAQEITGEDNVDKLLERALNLGNFMVYDQGVYRLRGVLIMALRNRAKKKLGTRLLHNCMYNAGRYYEQQEDIEKAFEMYERSGDSESIRSLLIRNGRRNPGAGYYYELRKYYLALDPDEVRSDAVLMTAVSMTYSILLQADKSEYWYQELKNYCSGFVFKGVVSSLTINYQLFDRDGNAVQARVSMRIRGKEEKSEKNVLSKPFESPDRTKYRNLGPADELWMLAYDEYDDAADWRHIAKENHILNPRKLDRTKMMKLPSI